MPKMCVVTFLILSDYRVLTLASEEGQWNMDIHSLPNSSKSNQHQLLRPSG